MNECALEVMKTFSDIAISYGESDEYSFVFSRKTTLFNRRKEKILSNVLSLFSSSYVFYWPKFFQGYSLKRPPCFDARIVAYPSLTNIKDYLSWRQADCHINNIFNTTFWCLVNKGNKSKEEAHHQLFTSPGKTKEGKNQILFEYGINYNDEPEILRRGTIILRNKPNKKLLKKIKQIQSDEESKSKHLKQQQSQSEESLKKKAQEDLPQHDLCLQVGLIKTHQDLIKSAFWEKYSLELDEAF